MLNKAFIHDLINKAKAFDDELFKLPGLTCEANLKVRRFDKIHPEISGNKIFKLSGWLEDYKTNNSILSFGGAYSNHLLALSAVGKAMGIKTIGIVRGEQPKHLNNILKQMQNNGMLLYYISRAEYRDKTTLEFEKILKQRFGEVFIIPEGGSGLPGAFGAMKMVAENEDFDYFILPGGTGTTALGLAMKFEHKPTKIICFQVLKGVAILKNEIRKQTGLACEAFPNLIFNEDFHFNGYAKFNQELIDFQASFLQLNGWKPDLIYGAKALYGLSKLLASGKLKSQKSNICYIHTGGIFD